MKKYPFWIKERHNPQRGVYYQGLGQMSRTAARKHERCLYGDNIMLRYDSKEAYEGALRDFKTFGEKVR